MAWQIGKHADAPQGALCYGGPDPGTVHWYEPDAGDQGGLVHQGDPTPPPKPEPAPPTPPAPEQPAGRHHPQQHRP